METVKKIYRYGAEQVRSTHILRYLTAGGLVALVDFLLLYILTDLFHVWYLTSSVIALLVAVIVSFILQKIWVFQNRSLTEVRIQFFLHILLSGVNIFLNTFLLYLLVEQMHLWYLLAQFLASGILACMNFFVYRKFIFV
jgi:dolichol-phosphate mannosyltransferase